MARGRIFEEVVIRINPISEQIQVEERKDGITNVKSVALDSIIECFGSSIRDVKRFSSGFLPENCLDYTVSGPTQSITLWHPAGRADITYHKTVYESFPLPKMVFSFDLNSKGQVDGSRMAIIADEKLKPSSQLYAYPFSNVYGDSSICIGAANSLPTYKNIHTLTGLPHLILSLPNNDHIFSAARNKLHLGHRELLDHLADKEPAYYYEHVLIPRKGKTLRHFIDEKLGDD